MLRGVTGQGEDLFHANARAQQQRIGVGSAEILGLIAALFLDSPAKAILWPSSLRWMGIACLADAARYRWINYHFTEPFFSPHGLAVDPLRLRNRSARPAGLDLDRPRHGELRRRFKVHPTARPLPHYRRKSEILVDRHLQPSRHLRRGRSDVLLCRLCQATHGGENALTSSAFTLRPRGHSGEASINADRPRQAAS